MSIEEVIADIVAKEMSKNTNKIMTEIKEILTDLVQRLNKADKYSLNSFVSEQVASEITGWSLYTLRKWRHLKKGPAYYKSDKTVRYKVADLILYIERSKIITIG